MRRSIVAPRVDLVPPRFALQPEGFRRQNVWDFIATLPKVRGLRNHSAVGTTNAVVVHAHTFDFAEDGHPQLAMAFIQSMTASSWNPSELRTLNALLQGSPAVEDVRKRTRERLLNDLPSPSRLLIERLSLKAGGFSRELVVDLGQVEPKIPDAGIVLETLIGSWVDQQEGNRFGLSPLLSGYAARTLSSDVKKQIESAIAESLTKSSTLDVVDMNSALLAAWTSENDGVLLKLCMAILSSDFSELEMLATHLPMFTVFSTDRIAYPANAYLSHVFRGVQVLLLNQDTGSDQKIQDALRCFAEESLNVEHDEMRASMSLLIYSKLLLQTSRVGLGTSFLGIVEDLNRLMESKELPADVLEGTRKLEEDGVTAIGFMFLNQARQLNKIEELRSVFDFLDGAAPDLRAKLLAPFSHEDFEVDMLVTGAWLCEHKQGTIDPSVHSEIFAQLESQACSWNETDLAVCCRKYQAIILDEYGSDREGALSILDEGLSKFGQSNSELVRAKAKVLHRSEDHKESLALSKMLIESDAPLSEVEKAFLGRDAAISAEKQGEFKTARRYYLYGSDAAKKSKLPDMAAMRVGLLADAALASWHDGDRQTCLQDFVAVLSELSEFRPDETLRTAHCHAVVRHVLLWLDQDATGEQRLLENNEKTKIYPGCVSNPEPHPEIKTRFIAPIEMAWYMLATVENHAFLGVGITENLERFLPAGPVLEGQMLLGSAKMQKAMTLLDTKLFISALRDTISYFSFVQSNGTISGGLDVKNVTYSTFPLATAEQQAKLQNLTEQFILLFCANFLFQGNALEILGAVKEISEASGFSVRPEVLDRLQSEGPTPDFHTDLAKLLFMERLVATGEQQGTPRQVFEVAFKSLQVAQQIGSNRITADSLVLWIEQRWAFVWDRQRFMLSRPSLHETCIKTAMSTEVGSPETMAAEILSAILPMLGIGNQSELEAIIATLPR